MYFYPRSPCGERLLTAIVGPLPPVFLSTLSLRRATEQAITAEQTARISIHALLAESDCGPWSTLPIDRAISIHALLAESDAMQIVIIVVDTLFLSTLSLRRATLGQYCESTERAFISIHALLAESDLLPCGGMALQKHFYPRSPCGERPRQAGQQQQHHNISIHALLAESDPLAVPHLGKGNVRFLSTLSLRRATVSMKIDTDNNIDFYPRSPCGERPHPIGILVTIIKFLSTLSLRRATGVP